MIRVVLGGQLMRDVLDFCYPHRCARCESNSWQDDAGQLTLGEVLDLALEPKQNRLHAV